ncbi:MAG TPA: hypothetical protein VK146_11845, partial [Tabrizicola sp.]|nr:hypothetical protein [Tabrizicola sp.]
MGEATAPVRTLLRARTLAGLALAVIVLGYLGRGLLPEALYVWPESLHLPLLDKANLWLDELLRKTEILDRPLRAWTRDLGEVLGVPMRFIQDLLANGWNYVDAEGNRTTLPPLPWLVIAALFAAASWLVSGVRLAVFTLATFVYYGVFGLWNEAMLTLASVTVCIVLGLVLGLV